MALGVGTLGRLCRGQAPSWGLEELFEGCVGHRREAASGSTVWGQHKAKEVTPCEAHNGEEGGCVVGKPQETG